MTNPRKYGSTGLFPSIKRMYSKPRAAINAAISAARKDYVSSRLASCIDCRRHLDGAALKIWSSAGRRRILPPECCDFCGRWPIDQALIDKGHLGVQSDPRWALDRMRLAAMRTTFAPGEKVMPNKRDREAESA